MSCRFVSVTTLVMLLLLQLLALPAGLLAQNLPTVSYAPWQELAPGVRHRAATSSSPLWKIWIIEADLSDSRVALLPVRNLNPGTYEFTSTMAQRVHAIAAINGGYFGGGQTYGHFEQFDITTSFNASTRPPRTVFGIGPGGDPFFMGRVSSSAVPSPANPL